MYMCVCVCMCLYVFVDIFLQSVFIYLTIYAKTHPRFHFFWASM